MRPLLLVLLLVWALTVFVTVDLFLNVPEFDKVRPRAALYRGMRIAGHEMVGEPYWEDYSLPETRREAPSHRQAPTPTTRGGDEGSLGPEELLRSIGSRGSADVRAFLRQLQNQPDPVLANALLDARFEIPEHLLGDYGLAAASMVAVLCAGSEGTIDGDSPEEVLAGSKGDLALAALDAQARRLDMAPPEPEPSDWYSARVVLERIAWVAPGFERDPPYADALGRVRAALVRFLETVDPAARADTRIEALRLAVWVGNERVARTCVELVRRAGLGSGQSTLTREEFLLLEHALRTVAYWGDSRDQADVLEWIGKAQAQARSLASQRRLDCLSQLVLAPHASLRTRELVERTPARSGDPMWGR